MNYKHEDFKAGMSFKANEINGHKNIEGKVQIQGDVVYLCQDYVNGADCDDRLGYRYSWSLGSYDFNEGRDSVSGLTLITDKKQKTLPVLYIVTYDRVDVDPYKTFTSKKEMNKWLNEVRDDRNIIFSSIKVYEVKKEFAVKMNFSLKKV